MKLEEKAFLVEDDGHYIVAYKEKEWSDWIYGGRRSLPMLSIEVFNAPCHSYPKAKRKKHKSRNNKDIIYRHAAQIFAEMLGQVCHKEFYDNTETEYQEVIPFIPHCFDRVNRPLSFMERIVLYLYFMPSFPIIISELSQSTAPNGKTIARLRRFNFGVRNDIICAQPLNESTFSNCWQSCFGISEVGNRMQVIYATTMGIRCIQWYISSVV